MNAPKTGTTANKAMTSPQSSGVGRPKPPKHQPAQSALHASNNHGPVDRGVNSIHDLTEKPVHLRMVTAVKDFLSVSSATRRSRRK